MKINAHPHLIFGAKRESLLGKHILNARSTISHFLKDKNSDTTKKIEMNVLTSIRFGGILHNVIDKENYQSIDSRLKFISLTSTALERLHLTQPRGSTIQKQKFLIHQTIVYLDTLLAISEHLFALSVIEDGKKEKQSDKQKEVEELVDEVDRIASTAEFNEMSLFTGDFAKSSRTASMWFLSENGEMFQIFIPTMTSKSLGLKDFKNDAITISNPSDFQNKVKFAIDRIKEERKQMVNVLES
ncbi:flagellar filament core protein flaB2 domain protein [Leptospira jelokensis]|uniref:flagellar filament core protein flaB2 domain protein n=1 Tax=Leptospira jelokensis TaxID=2484931 RepID=UPI0010912B10|nr:flagellar filament core protein flaB2 domain protein [Leptospira jelokensis]